MNSLLGLFQQHPVITTFAVLALLGTFAARMRDKVQDKNSRWYHFLDMVACGCSSLIEAIQAAIRVVNPPQNPPSAGAAPAAGPIGTPGGASKLPAVLVALAAVYALHASPAQAQVTYSVGPTFPAVLFDLDSGSQVEALDGAGVQVSFSDAKLQRAFFGKSWDLLDLALMGFGTRVSGPSGAAYGQLSGAVGVCTLSSLLCFVGGKHVLDTSGGFTGRHGWFVGFHVGFNLGLSPQAPPMGVEQGPPGLPRGNTLFIGP